MKQAGETWSNDRETSSGGRLKILLADDNLSLLQKCQSVLSREFEIVSAVADGRALLEQCELLRPEVVVTDISMPVIDGFEAVAKLHFRGAPRVIFFTVHEDRAFVEEAKALGAAGYVLKRSRPAVLIHAI
ncbi:MAG TPA: response regulator transcription factor, partial [Bryobacteraceae bacterium]